MTVPPPSKNAPRKRTLYEILGVERDANAIDIGVAYKRRLHELERAVNPDPNEPGLVHDAYHILCMPEERAAYDASLVTREEKAAAAAQAQSPDLVLEPEPEEKARRPWWIWAAAAAVVVAIAAFLALRSGPAPDARAKAVAEAPAAPEPPPPPPPPQKKTAKEILAAVSGSVVRVVSYEISGRSVAVGHGVVSEAGHVVTTCHGLPAGGQLVVQSGAESFPANLLVADESLDLCKLAVAGFEARALAPAADEPRAGDPVYLVAAAEGAAPGVSEGRVKQVRTTPSGKVYELTMPVAPGASGAGLFDAYGRLAGIATAPHRYGAGVQVALPVAWLAQMQARGKPEAAAK